MKKAYNLSNQKHLITTILLLLFTAGNFVYSQTENVVINEINYRSVAIQQDIDFIELYNAGATTVDLTGWQLADGVSYQFPAGTTINAGAYLVVAGDPSTCQSIFGFNGALGPYSGKLSSDGENVELRDQAFNKIDKVDYESWKEWPAVRFLDEGDEPVSIQKINPNLAGKHGGSWSSNSPTPKAANNSVGIANINAIPVIKEVSKSPNKPTSGEEVRIKADMDNLENLSGTLSVSLEYQVVQPGNYIHKSDDSYTNNWTAIPMLDNGVGADATADNGTYTAAIPANVQVHRNLIRYRVKVSSSTGFNKTYPDQRHTDSNYAYYVYDGYPNVGNYDIDNIAPMQDFTIITGNSTADKYIGPGNGSNNSGQYSGSSFLGEGTLVYNGKVYDHIRFRPRGKSGGRGDRLKPALKFDMNKEHTLAPLKGCGDDQYDEKRGKITLSGTYVNDIATHGFTESLIHKTLNLMGAMGRGTEYTQFRIVDESAEAKDFWGIFMIIEGYDGEYLKENDYPEGNIWRHKSGRIVHQGDFPNSDDIGDWSRSNPVDWDVLLADKAANMFMGNGASNYEGKHSQRDYYNSENGKWHVWYGDYDTMFGMSSDNATFHDRSSSSYDDDINLVQSLSGKEEEFKNVMRSAYDLLFNQQQINFLIDNEAGKIHNPNTPYDWTTLDRYRWNQDYDLGSVSAQINWYRSWFDNRSRFLLNDASDGFRDSDIPQKPVISLTGTNALDKLTFNNSAFSDPQGPNTFSSLEWRVGEWSDPSNPVYQNTCKPKYEIEPVWESGEINSFSSNFTIPSTAQLEPGRTYKIRVRYKDNSGVWSHWSDAVQVVPTPANTDNPSLVINEIMYNPSDICGSEFVEIKNTTNSSIALDGFAFTDGITYNFPAGKSIAAGSYIVIAKDSVAFQQKYGFRPFGDYSGSLSNGGERLELSGPFNALMDSLTYDNKAPWDELADGEGSLELLDTNVDNSKASSWCHSASECGTPGSANDPLCPVLYECPELTANIGDACDDNDSNTQNDQVQADCSCAGTSIYDCPALMANIGDTCNDGNSSTQNDVVQVTCVCAGTTIQPTYDCPALTANIGDACNDNNANTENDAVQANCSCAGTIIYDCPALTANIGDACNDNNANTENDAVQANCSCAGTIIPIAYDCPALTANIGDACDDNNANTQNDAVQTNCTCAGDPIFDGNTTTESCNGNTSITYGNGAIKMDGLTNGEYFFQVFTDNWQQVFNCGWQCGASQIVTGLAPGDYRVFIKNSNYQIICLRDITLGTTASDPDNDNDGLPVSQDCNDNDANLTTIGAICNDGDIATENDVVQANCTCAGTPIMISGNTTTESCNGNTSITYGNGAIKMDGLGNSEYFFQVFTSSWQQVFNCGWQCGASKTVTGLPPGGYRIFIKNSGYQIICVKDILLGTDGAGNPDNDNDGVPANQDCNDNDANVSTPGATCNDGNATTENDVVQANCTCAGTPISGGGSAMTTTCGDIAVSYGDGTVTLQGIAGKQYYFKINDLNDGWKQVAGCSYNCGYQFEKTGLPNSRYLITIYNKNWSKHCDTEIVMGASNITEEASSRTALKKEKVNFNLGLEAVEIFPNPAKQELFINMSTQEEQVDVKIINLFGQVMTEIRREQVLEDLMRLDISKLEKGLYHVMIQVKGKRPITRKVMVD